MLIRYIVIFTISMNSFPVNLAANDDFDELFFSINNENNEESLESNALLNDLRIKLSWRTGLAIEAQESNVNHNRQNREISQSKVDFLIDFQNVLANNLSYKMELLGYYDLVYDVYDTRFQNTTEKNEQQTEFEMGELFIKYPLNDNCQFTLGRKIHSWGESEITRIIDIVNPRDQRRPGQIDMDRLRLPVGSVRLDYRLDDVMLEYITVFESRSDKLAAAYSDFDPYILMRNNFSIQEDNTSSFFETYQHYFRMRKRMSYSDFSIIVADDLIKSPLVSNRTQSKVLSKHFPRRQRVALTANRTVKNTLIKLETAFDIKNPEQTIDSISGGIHWKNKQTVYGMLGFQYYGLSDTLIGIELSGKEILDYEDSLQDKKRTLNYSFFIERQFLRNKLNTELVLFGFNGYKNNIIRANMNYELNQGMFIAVSFIQYSSKDDEDLLNLFRKNDELSIELTKYL